MRTSHRGWAHEHSAKPTSSTWYTIKLGNLRGVYVGPSPSSRWRLIRPDYLLRNKKMKKWWWNRFESVEIVKLCSKLIRSSIQKSYDTSRLGDDKTCPSRTGGDSGGGRDGNPNELLISTSGDSGESGTPGLGGGCMPPWFWFTMSSFLCILAMWIDVPCRFGNTRWQNSRTYLLLCRFWSLRALSCKCP